MGDFQGLPYPNIIGDWVLADYLVSGLFIPLSQHFGHGICYI